MSVGVLGGGAFGTAMAQLMGRNNYKVKMWVRKPSTRESINERHENPVYLKGFTLSENITAKATVQEAVEGASLVIVAVPTPFLRETFAAHRDVLPTKVPIVLLSKGLENHSLMTPLEIMREELPGKYGKYICAVSGPSFANEIARGLPTNVTCASDCPEVALRVQAMISDRMFRVYTTDDTMGVEYGGALKNVIAIATGCSDGLGMGFNARAALITRGLAEISRLAVAKGGRPITMLSLAGVGDLLLTCTAPQSRNYSVGYRIAKGETLAEIQATMTEVAEGVLTAKAVYALANEMNLELPICKAVYEVLYTGKPLLEAVSELLDREPRGEIAYPIT
jgi:glycerol-3-phosphate dehydrogenase (NAD(P)+)